MWNIIMPHPEDDWDRYLACLIRCVIFTKLYALFVCLHRVLFIFLYRHNNHIFVFDFILCITRFEKLRYLGSFMTHFRSRNSCDHWILLMIELKRNHNINILGQILYRLQWKSLNGTVVSNRCNFRDHRLFSNILQTTLEVTKEIGNDCIICCVHVLRPWLRQYLFSPIELNLEYNDHLLTVKICTKLAGSFLTSNHFV